MLKNFPYEAILFDLDGTLVDTAPDLALALNTLLKEEGEEEIPFSMIRPYVSYGSPALIKLGFGEDIPKDYYDELRVRFLTIYENNIHVYSGLFNGMNMLLDRFDEHGYPWGIVTNKPGYLTDKLLLSLDLFDRASCIVSGDTLTVKKPDPEPMYLAASECGCEPEKCAYIGDALRDIEAGRNAGMDSFAAAYGYISIGENPQTWNATGVFHAPDQVLEWYLHH